MYFQAIEIRTCEGDDVEVLLVIQTKNLHTVYGSPKLLKEFVVENHFQDADQRKLEKEKVVIKEEKEGLCRFPPIRRTTTATSTSTNTDTNTPRTTATLSSSNVTRTDHNLPTFSTESSPPPPSPPAATW